MKIYIFGEGNGETWKEKKNQSDTLNLIFTLLALEDTHFPLLRFWHLPSYFIIWEGMSFLASSSIFCPASVDQMLFLKWFGFTILPGESEVNYSKTKKYDCKM